MPKAMKRPLSVIVLSLTIVGVTVVTVRATNLPMDNFCQYWSFSLESPDYLWCDSYQYNWSGAYDVSSKGEEALNWAADICDGLTFSCWDTCESSSYKNWLSWSQSGQCSYGPECFVTWGTPMCQQGESAEFSCSCSYMNFCAPC